MQSLFFIAILPPTSISNDIDEIRKQCALDHKVYSALKPPVHITLIPPFYLAPVLEQKLISSLEQCRNFQPFEQELKDYDGFPPRVVFIKALKNPGVIALHKILRERIKIYLEKIPGSINPHITIAYRDVEPKVYEQIMEAYGKRHFRAHFKVSKFALLKHDGKKWNLFKEFESRPQEEQYKMEL
ncbi:2'-5' RNA ligase family protein [Pedobacter heparinus]|uniref:2'-5' RNA ligase family protein n=1 Tax=Pedobacter heparinus TaxID=984 RepID=UPI00292FCC9E|nr:2'-5' RNA ligase family protein [Pedobacter heparinus]